MTPGSRKSATSRREENHYIWPINSLNTSEGSTNRLISCEMKMQSWVINLAPFERSVRNAANRTPGRHHRLRTSQHFSNSNEQESPVRRHDMREITLCLSWRWIEEIIRPSQLQARSATVRAVSGRSIDKVSILQTYSIKGEEQREMFVLE